MGISDVYADVIQGHAPDTEGQKYGIFPIETLAAEIEKLPRFEIEKPNQQFWVASLDEKALPD